MNQILKARTETQNLGQVGSQNLVWTPERLESVSMIPSGTHTTGPPDEAKAASSAWTKRALCRAKQWLQQLRWNVPDSFPPHGMSFIFPPAAKNEVDRRLERFEIKRRLTRKVRVNGSSGSLWLMRRRHWPVDSSTSCPRDPRWPNSRPGRSCVSTSTSRARTPTTTTAEQISPGPSWLLLTRWDFVLSRKQPKPFGL